MVPARPAADKPPFAAGAALVARLRLTARPAALALLLWLLTVALPWLELSGQQPALSRTAILVLVFAPPFALLWAATQGSPWLVFATACLGTVPALIAAPALATANAGLVRQAAIAIALGVLLAQAADSDGVASPLRRLWRWPAGLGDRLRLTTLAGWLALACWPAPSVGRVSAAAVVWMVVQAVPVGANRHGLRRHRQRWLLARALWLLLVGLATWLHREGA